MDSVANWNFDKGATGRWTWSYVDPTVGFETKCSLKDFASLVECMNDAMRNGYKANPSSYPPERAAAAPKAKSRLRAIRGKPGPSA
jgi:hypothetical protein